MNTPVSSTTISTSSTARRALCDPGTRNPSGPTCAECTVRIGGVVLWRAAAQGECAETECARAEAEQPVEAALSPVADGGTDGRLDELVMDEVAMVGVVAGEGVVDEVVGEVGEE